MCAHLGQHTVESTLGSWLVLTAVQAQLLAKSSAEVGGLIIFCLFVVICLFVCLFLGWGHNMVFGGYCHARSRVAKGGGGKKRGNTTRKGSIMDWFIDERGRGTCPPVTHGDCQWYKQTRSAHKYTFTCMYVSGSLSCSNLNGELIFVLFTVSQNKNPPPSPMVITLITESSCSHHKTKPCLS